MLGQQSPEDPTPQNPQPPTTNPQPLTPYHPLAANKTISAACFQAPLRQMLHGSQMATKSAGGFSAEKIWGLGGFGS